MCVYTISLNSRFRYPPGRTACREKNLIPAQTRNFIFPSFNSYHFTARSTWVIYYCTQTTGTVPFFIIRRIILRVRSADIPTAADYTPITLSLSLTIHIHMRISLYYTSRYVFLLKCTAYFGFIAQLE
ncbi:unnamed protein product [Aphis gossypii]|uniref:Uncharacterized protein n=1 Tax=Aphis gossypii TaxID=80765 RepID=A0A9P0JJ47_APHGO|nr:unnamed protein product [Aphis gossypii]